MPEILKFTIFDPIKNTLNGVPIDDIESRLSSEPKLPQGMHGACHLHNPIKYFKTFDELRKHIIEWHDYRKQKIG